MAINFGINESVRERHFLVTKAEKKPTRSGSEYYQLELADKDGKIEAKVWDNVLPICKFEIGKVIEVNGKTQEYMGKISLIIDSCQIVTSEDAINYSPTIPTMVFDIETIGKKFEDLDESEQDYLLNNLEKNEEDKEKAKNKTGLYSIFGMVCAIGFYDPSVNKGTVLVIADKELTPQKENYTYEIFKDEKEMLERFWKSTSSFEQFVTYNGDNFDFPYLAIRSGINRVKVPFEIKKWSDRFIDLQNKIRQSHAFKLEFLCKAFGIENPKEEGVHGNDVNDLYYEGDYQKIADYVARDAYSTTQLYLIWKEFMSGEVA